MSRHRRKPEPDTGHDLHRFEVPCRLRQRIRDRSASGRAAGRPELAAARALRPLRRAVVAARRSPRRARATGARGCTASARRRCTSRSRRIDDGARSSSASTTSPTPPNQLRWDPLPMPAAADRFRRRPGHDGRQRRPRRMTGCGIHLYAANRSMQDRFFYDADGELLIVPQQGRLRFATELGVLDVEPQEIAVIPRGVRFRVALPDGSGARLCLRELRRAAAPARPRPDRLERPRQSARLPDAGRRLRGPRRRVRARREVHGPALARATSTTRRSTSSPGTATTRRTSTTCAASTRSARSATTIPIRRSSSCCSRRATRPASTRSTS